MTALFPFMACIVQPASVDLLQRLEARIAQTDQEIEMIRQGIAESYQLLEIHESKLTAYQQVLSLAIGSAEGIDEDTAAAAEGRADRSISTETEYQQALELYYQHQYDDSMMAFKEFLAKRQGHHLCVNALYWLGECSYAKKQYQEAIGLFTRILVEHPAGNKTPDALLKIGYAYFFMNRQQQAAEHLKRAALCGGKIEEKANWMLRKIER